MALTAGESRGGAVGDLGAGVGARFRAFWTDRGGTSSGGGGSCGGLVRQESAPRRNSDMAGACFGRLAGVVSEMRIGTELEDGATAPDFVDVRGEFVFAVRAVGAGFGPRGFELTGMATPRFRAFERCCTGLGRDAGLGPNTTTDAGTAARVARVFGRHDGLFGTAD